MLTFFHQVVLVLEKLEVASSSGLLWRARMLAVVGVKKCPFDH